MRTKMIAAFCVLAVMVALCYFATSIVQRDSEALRELGLRAIAACEVGDTARAESLVREILISIDERRLHLEVLAQHDDINEIALLATEARVRIERGQQDEFLSAMAQYLETITILGERQKLTIGNLF